MGRDNFKGNTCVLKLSNTMIGKWKPKTIYKNKIRNKI